MKSKRRIKTKDLVAEIETLNPAAASALRHASASVLRHLFLQSDDKNFFRLRTDTENIVSLSPETARAIARCRPGDIPERSYYGDIEFAVWGGRRGNPFKNTVVLRGMTITESAGDYVVNDSYGNVVARKRMGVRGTFAFARTEPTAPTPVPFEEKLHALGVEIKNK